MTKRRLVWSPGQNPQIKGHPRSGNNFLAASIALNFYKPLPYNLLIRKRLHELPLSLDRVRTDIKTLYIWRPFDPVFESLWKMRRAFSIRENDKERFRNSSYRSSIDRGASRRAKRIPGEPVAIYQDTGKLKVVPSGFFANVDLTPYEFWKTHVERWSSFAEECSNILIISYDSLNANFDQEMQRIACHLEVSRENFVRSPGKVGIKAFVEED